MTRFLVRNIIENRNRRIPLARFEDINTPPRPSHGEHGRDPGHAAFGFALWRCVPGPPGYCAIKEGDVTISRAIPEEDALEAVEAVNARRRRA